MVKYSYITDDLLEIIKLYGYQGVQFTKIKNRKLAKNHIVVVDTIGELSALYSIARIVFIGKSLTKRGGQNVIEPAFFGKPTIVGPYTENFRDVISLFLKNVYNFLGVADSFRAPSANKVINSAMEKRRKLRFSAYITTQLKKARRNTEKFSVGRIIILMWRKLRLFKIIESLERKSRAVVPASARKKNKPQISHSTRSALLKLYTEDVSYVEKVTGKKLDTWKL